MVETRRGKQTDGKKATSSKCGPQKRKAQQAAAKDGGNHKKSRLDSPRNASSTTADKENQRPQTPQPAEEQHPRTPGRVGPVKQSCSCEPDIKPFRGEPGHKVRKSAWEKEKEYTDFVKQHEGHMFHELHVCYDKGPNGSPTYDKAGFELDFEKVADWMKPVSVQTVKRRMGTKKYNDGFDKSIRDTERMHQIFFGVPSRADVPYFVNEAAKDRVSKDLQIPCHRIGVAEFEDWETRGFQKHRLDEYSSLSQAQQDRLMNLFSGSALRK
ncbi:hypothetical protein K491DRAFT_717738 [Lophiostoma macrostomum CBS 122681]|uniref:Uncharacterized protein n=1 Tax=Lophiostoma macrostomum CBS 122681 TaxID=1314788 RepID=A0A6A6T1Z6_9PLEO|nr:hypothetical protein K491DRAFT_717738 [Lophiostoma macrostomum CBS 122681]